MDGCGCGCAVCLLLDRSTWTNDWRVESLCDNFFRASAPQVCFLSHEPTFKQSRLHEQSQESTLCTTVKWDGSVMVSYQHPLLNHALRHRPSLMWRSRRFGTPLFRRVLHCVLHTRLLHVHVAKCWSANSGTASQLQLFVLLGFDFFCKQLCC